MYRHNKFGYWHRKPIHRLHRSGHLSPISIMMITAISAFGNVMRSGLVRPPGRSCILIILGGFLTARSPCST